MRSEVKTQKEQSELVAENNAETVCQLTQQIKELQLSEDEQTQALQ